MKLRIKHKLFFAFIWANIFVVLGIFILSSLVFSNSFREYLDANKEQQYAPLVNALILEYHQNSGWQRITSQRDKWGEFIKDYVIENSTVATEESREARDSVRLPSKRRRPPPGTRPPPPQNGPDFFAEGHRPPPENMHLFLADVNKVILLGRKSEVDRINWMDVIVEEQVVGYLGYFRTSEISSELDQLFIEKLRTNISWIVVLVISVSGMIALLLSRLLVEPILRLSRATRKIIKGDFRTRMSITSNDEIGELCQDFNRLAQSLESNLSARQQWIADISHELRTPVAILQGELEAIQDGVREPNEQSIQSLHQETQRLANIIADLHELSMSDMGALTYQFENVDIVEIIENVVDSKRSSFKELEIDVQWSNPRVPIIVKADRNRLDQLFLNLLNNSLSYTQQGGMLSIAIAKREKEVQLLWSDSEPGVNDQQLSKLFERLYRVESSRNRNSGGSGLGLSISKNIVEAHCGTITAKHAELGGVTFEIILPM